MLRGGHRFPRDHGLIHGAYLARRLSLSSLGLFWGPAPALSYALIAAVSVLIIRLDAGANFAKSSPCEVYLALALKHFAVNRHAVTGPYAEAAPCCIRRAPFQGRAKASVLSIASALALAILSTARTLRETRQRARARPWRNAPASRARPRPSPGRGSRRLSVTSDPSSDPNASRAAREWSRRAEAKVGSRANRNLQSPLGKS